MLIEESIWIGEKIKELSLLNPFPILNIGSSTKEYRTNRQSHIQKNIFNLIPNEAKNVIHLDMKSADGVDLVGDLYDSVFLDEIKKYKVKCILFNNVLMYIDQEQRKKLCKVLYEILEKDGYLIVTNSFIFPPAPDPVESYYRPNPTKLYEDLFQNFELKEAKEITTGYNFYQQLKDKPRLIPIKLLRVFLPFYKFQDWRFMMKYYFNHLKRNYSASCLLLQKK